MGKRSRDKGKRGEREAAEALAKALSCTARRGVQYQGGEGSPDVQHSIQGLHIEVKRCEQFRLYDALDQAEADAGEFARPLVLHRKNLRQWVAVCSLDHLAEIALTIAMHLPVSHEAFGRVRVNELDKLGDTALGMLIGDLTAFIETHEEHE